MFRLLYMIIKNTTRAGKKFQSYTFYSLVKTHILTVAVMAKHFDGRTHSRTHGRIHMHARTHAWLHKLHTHKLHTRGYTNYTHTHKLHKHTHAVPQTYINTL